MTSRRGSSTERFTRIVETIVVFGTKIAAALVGGERRVAERDLVHNACELLHGYPIAEPDGLREGEQNARAEIPERRGERETRDDREHGARSEKRTRDLLRGGEDRQHAPGADDDDDRDDHAQEKAERGPTSCRDGSVGLGKPLLVLVVRGIQEHAEHDHDDDPHRGGDECAHGVRVHARGFGVER